MRGPARGRARRRTNRTYRGGLALEPYARVPRKLLNDDLMPSTAKAVYAALDGYLNKKTGDCSPPLGRLAADLGVSQRWLIHMLAWLESHGWVVVERSCGRRNRYLSEPSGDPRRGFVLKRREPETSEAEFTGTSEAEFTGTSEAEFT